MADLIYYCTFGATAVLVLVALILSRRAIKSGGNKKVYANRFVAASMLAGVISGLLLYYGVLWIFDATGHHVNVGHGEALIAAPFFNFILGLVLAMLGRVLLLWQSLRL